MIKRLEFKKKVINFNHDMYYYLIDHIKESEIARGFNPDNPISGQNWMNQRMFRVGDYSILKVEVTEMHWKFFLRQKLLISYVPGEQIHRDLQQTNIGFLGPPFHRKTCRASNMRTHFGGNKLTLAHP